MNKLMTIAAVGLLIAGVGMVTVNAAETTGTATVKTLKNGLKNGAKNGLKNGLKNGMKNGKVNGDKK